MIDAAILLSLFLSARSSFAIEVPPLEYSPQGLSFNSPPLLFMGDKLLNLIFNHRCNERPSYLELIQKRWRYRGACRGNTYPIPPSPSTRTIYL
jgi:hypothetical protein